MSEEPEIKPSEKQHFGGLRVAALESRRAEEMHRLIERFGGQPHVSPSLREVPLEQNRGAIEFAHRLLTGEIGVVIFLTGVGFKYLLEIVDRHLPRQRYLDALADMITVVRGPKPAAAMKEVGLTATHKVPPPNTWREILTLVDKELVIANQTVALQEYGKTNRSLTAGLEARGAHVLNVPVYRWDLPVERGPLEENIRAVIAGQRDVLLFTSAHQVVNLFQAAENLELSDALRSALANLVIASIGPTTTEMLHEYELHVDIEPEQGKMGQLVAAAAAGSPETLRRKRRVAAILEPNSASADTRAACYDSPFLKACRLERTDVTPIWLMRQAGRYMEEYRRIREKTTFLELCKNPALCSEVMCTAVKRLGVDAAIVFSDLLPILEPMGLDLEFSHGEGPVIHNPIRAPEDVDHLRELERMDALEFVCEAVRQTRRDLPPHIPLIGFAGAPFTLASYAIEGGASRNYTHTKTLMYRDEGAWREMMSRFARAITLYLTAQIHAGAQCVQLFDSWVGCLGVDDYRHYVLPFIRQIIAGLPHGIPVINFATGNPAIVPLLADSGAAVVGLDWRIPLDEGWRLAGDNSAIQGNLDPAVLLADREEIRRRAKDILHQADGRPGHIFNLGHGILPQTPVDHAIALVDAVHELSSRE